MGVIKRPNKKRTGSKAVHPRQRYLEVDDRHGWDPYFVFQQFQPISLPYRQAHVQSVLSVLFGCGGSDKLSSIPIDVQDFLDDDTLWRYRESYLLSRPDRGCSEQGDLRAEPSRCNRLKYEPLRMAVQSVLVATMEELGFDILDAYAARRRVGKNGYYRSERYPCWQRASIPGPLGGCYSQIAHEVGKLSLAVAWTIPN